MHLLVMTLPLVLNLQSAAHGMRKKFEASACTLGLPYFWDRPTVAVFTHCTLPGKGYGHSVIFLAYFLTKLSSLKMNSERLTVKQFWRTGMGL